MYMDIYIYIYMYLISCIINIKDYVDFYGNRGRLRISCITLPCNIDIFLISRGEFNVGSPT